MREFSLDAKRHLRTGVRSPKAKRHSCAIGAIGYRYPHQMFYTDNAAGLIPHTQQDVKYASFHRPTEITEGPNKALFRYGTADERREMRFEHNGVPVYTKQYMPDGVERILDGNGWLQYELTYVPGNDGIAFIWKKAPGVVQRQSGSDSGALTTSKEPSFDDGEPWEPSTSTLYYPYTDHLGSIVALTDGQGIVLQRQAFDAWGRRRNPRDWETNDRMTPRSGFEWLRGYTGHEHLDSFGLINMNARLYDPKMGRMLSVDNYVSDATSAMAYNRYTYALNNPISYIDPTGNDPVTVAIIIGAVVGAYIGGSTANGNYDPTLWDYSSGKTWGYMVGGAITGAASGYVGATIAAGGGFMANTAGIMASSFTNSLGTAVYTGGQSDFTVSFGVGSYNFTKGEFGYLGKPGNSFMENLGYGLGAFANVSDAWAIYNGAYGSRVDDINLRSGNHSILETKEGDRLLDVGTMKQRSTVTNKEGLFGKLEITTDYRGYQDRTYNNPIDPGTLNRIQHVGGVRLDRLSQYKVALDQSGKTYGFLRLFGGKSINCAGAAAMGLLKSGVFNIPIAIPGALSLQMYMRQFSFMSAYSIYR